MTHTTYMEIQAVPECFKAELYGDNFITVSSSHVMSWDHCTTDGLMRYLTPAAEDGARIWLDPANAGT
jgi:hypothetical protein